MARRPSSRARTRASVSRGATASGMDSAVLYAATLADLNSAIVRMTSPRFDALLQTGSAEDRMEAMRKMLAVEKARLVLGNAILQDIASKLKENEPALIEGREQLDDALERLESIAEVLNAISGFLQIIGKVVTLI
jgi:hypothetical protein